MVTNRLRYSAHGRRSPDAAGPRTPATRSTKLGSPSVGMGCQGAEAFWGGAGMAVLRQGAEAEGGAGNGVVLCQGATGAGDENCRDGIAMDFDIVVGMAGCFALAAAKASIDAFGVAPLLCAFDASFRGLLAKKIRGLHFNIEAHRKTH